MGKPIVATDVNGCREVVDTGNNGVLVPPRDPASLADAIRTVISDTPTMVRFGTASREKALAEFDERKVASRYMELYKHLVDNLSSHTQDGDL